MKPRMQWLRERVKEVILELQRLEYIEDWVEYKNLVGDLSKELHYATTEWEKYYND